VIRHQWIEKHDTLPFHRHKSHLSNSLVMGERNWRGNEREKENSNFIAN